jgi:SAM-dependent methyltransferase
MSRREGPISTSDVADYYDRNTARFRFMGRGAPSLHRALWAPGVRSSRDAVGYIDRVIADELASQPWGTSPVVLDFGCGIGGTLFHLAARFPNARLVGVTVSGKQVTVANRLASERGFVARCSFSQGDFQTIDLGVEADAIIAVESFVHSTTPDAFLANATRHLRTGGRLLVVDDFLSADVDSLPGHQRRRVDELRAGWRIPSLCTVPRFLDSAAGQGLTLTRALDLTALTRPGSRLRDRLTAAVSPLALKLGLVRMPFYGNMIGGNALQIGLRDGFLTYRMLVLEKAPG